MTRILLVEDEAALSEPLAYLLRARGLRGARSPTTARARSPRSTGAAPTSCCST